MKKQEVTWIVWWVIICDDGWELPDKATILPPGDPGYVDTTCPDMVPPGTCKLSIPETKKIYLIKN